MRDIGTHAVLEVKNAECGDLQAIQFVASFHPDPEVRAMWESVFMGEVELWFWSVMHLADAPPQGGKAG